MDGFNDYSINYVDGSYRIVTWHLDDFMEIAGKITEKEHAVIIDECLYVLTDIRAIIKLPPQEVEPEKEETTPEQPSGEYDFLDFQTKQYLSDVMKIDVDKGGIIND